MAAETVLSGTVPGAVYPALALPELFMSASSPPMGTLMAVGAEVLGAGASVTRSSATVATFLEAFRAVVVVFAAVFLGAVDALAPPEGPPECPPECPPGVGLIIEVATPASGLADPLAAVVVFLAAPSGTRSYHHDLT